jgi:hypothetical protein
VPLPDTPTKIACVLAQLPLVTFTVPDEPAAKPMSPLSDWMRPPPLSTPIGTP